jgi:triphosphoribosyl-dephospho-CoA synthase
MSALPRSRAAAPLAALGRAATAALHDELALYPKPGLVSFVDNGSHADMDGRTFMRSLFSLRHYFPHIAALGAAQVPFEALEQAGIAAEQRMLRATGGINTHRGAIFSLGLLCASAGRLGQAAPAPEALRASLLSGWGEALALRARAWRPSHGQVAARRFGLHSIGDEAAAGFPSLFDVAVPALQHSLAAGLGWRLARLQTLFALIAVLDDTTLAHRGGLAGLRFAQHAAQGYLDRGGVAADPGLALAEALHRQFVARRLSAGGSADLLAAACWVWRVGAPA